jgi:peroxiredoxin
MAQLRRDHAEFVARNAEIVVVGPESTERFGDYWREHDLPFIGLPDAEHRVLKLYGQEVSLFRLGRMPASVLIDCEGVARFVHYGHSMSDIPSTAELLTLLDELNAA